MNCQEIIDNILNNTNFHRIISPTDDFTKLYIRKLLENIILYVDSNISLGDITLANSYQLEQEISQEIIGLQSAYSAMDGNVRVLTAFAESYSKLGIIDFDSLCKEALLDFMNLQNGLFIVELSQKQICELSLSVPKHSGLHKLNSTEIEGNITLIPINFKYGTITFVLLKTS